MASSTEQAKTYKPHAAAEEEFQHLQRLLRGACRSLYRLTADLPPEKMSEAWGPEVLEYWMRQDEYADERARRVLLSLPDRDIDALNAYLKRHGELPK